MDQINNSEIVRIIVYFIAAVNNMRLYPPNHPQVNTLFDCLYENTVIYFKRTPELTFSLFDDDIIASEKLVTGTGLAGEAFKKLLSDKNIERLTLLEGLPRKQLYNLIGDLASPSKPSVSATSHIKLGKLIYDEIQQQNNNYVDKFNELLLFNQKTAKDLKHIYMDIQGNRLHNTDKAKNIVTTFTKIYNKSINPLKILTNIKSTDDYTSVHTTNVALLTICFADYLGFSGRALQDIGVAALLHDVGKMSIPEEILNKPGPLTAQERAVMETHPLKGAQYIGYQKEVPKLTMIAALEHHLKHDGSGYPRIHHNWRPNIISQMICIADVYDAMRSNRPYKKAAPYNIIKNTLQEGMGSTYDSNLVGNFLKMIER